MPYGCSCSPLCDACVAERLSWWTGVAQLRGRRLKPGQDPRSVLVDLTSDERLLKRLAVEVLRGAGRAWDASAPR